VFGTIMVALGVSSVGAHLIKRLPESASHTISLVGGATMLVGLVMAFGALAMMLFENVYIAIENERLLFHDNGKEMAVKWDVLEGIEVESKTGILVVKRTEGAALRWYAGKPAADIAGKVREAKRKAMHGLLKTTSTPPPSS